MKPKTVDDYVALPYTIELVPEPGVGVFARVVELPGCVTQGDTEEEALAMIREAMRLWIEVALEDGDPIPLPRQQHSYSGRISLRMPKSLHEQVAREAEFEGVSINQFIVTTLKGAVTSRKAVRLAVRIAHGMFQGASKGISAAVVQESLSPPARMRKHQGTTVMTSWESN